MSVAATPPSAAPTLDERERRMYWAIADCARPGKGSDAVQSAKIFGRR